MNKNEISVDRVEGTENIADCTCSICQNIFHKPIMCKTCENHFCSKCIKQWIVNNPRSCPFCKNFEERKSSLILNNILDKLKIRCVNKERGCQEILIYQFLNKHEESCSYGLIKKVKESEISKSIKNTIENEEIKINSRDCNVNNNERSTIERKSLKDSLSNNTIEHDSRQTKELLCKVVILGESGKRSLFKIDKESEKPAFLTDIFLTYSKIPNLLQDLAIIVSI